PVTLAPVTIYPVDLSARDLLRQAFRHRRQNSPPQPYGLRTFYRHYCQESGVYGRLIEGAFDLYDAEGHARLRREPDQKITVQLRQVRRSLDFTRLSGHRHAPLALFQTLARDVTAYHSPLSRHYDDASFHCTFQDTVYYDGQVVYVVRLSGRLGRGPYQAEVHIAADDFGILQVEAQQSQHWGQAPERVLQVDRFVVRYQRLGDRYFPQFFLNEGRRTEQYLDDTGRSAWSRDHVHHVSLLVNEVVPVGMHPFLSREPGERALAEAPYDPAFWDSYTELAATPLETRIAEDLAARIPLAQQFALKAGGPFPPEVQDQLSEVQLQRLLQSHRGQPVLLVFWDASYALGLRDLLRVRKLIEGQGAQGLGLVFISLDQNADSWQTAIRKRRLLAFDHLRLGRGQAAPLAQVYGVGGIPWLVLLDARQAVVWTGEGLPPSDQLDYLLEQVFEKP
ncbi:MAG: hypothetical protein D6722_17570, partial [Bacteroidetes bacterium]